MDEHVDRHVHKIVVQQQDVASEDWRDIPLGVLGEIATAALAWYDARYPNLDPSKCFMSSDALLATIERHGLRDRDAGTTCEACGTHWPRRFDLTEHLARWCQGQS